MTVSKSVLFHPIKIGRSQLQHRVVMAPLTRHRADENHVHTELGLEYYSQRAGTPGTLLITEGTFISLEAGGMPNVPGIYNAAQIAAWKRITDAVHAKGSFIYLQLWALGRSAWPEELAREGLPLVGASSKPVSEGGLAPRPLTVPEIHQWIQDYAQAARNSIEAGFDGVEIHGANGYIIDQFLQDVTNDRTDEYGGSIERRSRFALEVVRAVTEAIGQDRTGIRFSPWGVFQNMRMEDPIPQFSHVIQSIHDLYPDFAYIHLVEPPVDQVKDIDPGNNDPFRHIWAPRPFLSANLHTPESAPRVAEEKGDVIVFGRYFISNPDLPLRLKKGIPVTPYNLKTMYLRSTALGYTDYPFAEHQDELLGGVSPSSLP
ncbi:NADH:flavin oxidoreductase/NADH oxidase [Ramaria rubella]|nr:NADH:flavin oxidoreductase/NADH oxidase [Ramaria rubella]